MAFDYDHLMNYPIPEARQTLAPRDCILYALSLGLGSDPVDENQLRFVYEKDLRALPTMANVLAHPGFWLKRPDTGVDWPRVLHGEQALTIHRPLPVEGTLVGRSRIRSIVDKGPEKGAFLYLEREVCDAATGEVVCTLEQTTVCRGDGGCGGPGGETPAPHRTPEREPDRVFDLATLPQSALLYRWNGDLNPLHADPQVAAGAGFPRPILHGLCTFGVAGHALLAACCDYQPERLRHMAARFTAPVFPGETIRTEIWVDGDEVSFQSLVPEREARVLGNGRARLAS